MSVDPQYFAQLYATSDDPWAFRSRWYERRKRELTLACLPRQHYQRVFEPGCANGELSAALAGRCANLLSQDLDPTALALARGRLADAPHAHVVAGSVPDDWPSGLFDLIVLSEFGYYLEPAQWRKVIERATASLTNDGAIVACHWRHSIEGCPQSGDQVHALLDEHLPLFPILRHEETDFLLEYWCRKPDSIDLDETCP